MPASDVAWAVESIRARLVPYALYRAYDEGVHRLAFATDKYMNAFGDLFREFADNMCDDVVDGLTDRLQVNAWTSEDQAVSAAADDVWERNRGQSRFGQVHRNGYREGDGWIMVQQDNQGRARFHAQRPEQMAVRYSQENPDEMEVVAKCWKEAKRYRLNLYYPDHREKYATKGLGADGGLPQAKTFLPLAAGDPALREDDSYATEEVIPGRMPVFHYPNGCLSDYGRSVLKNIIPIQDALNKGVSDMLVAMEFLAYPQRWATGVQVERDPITGEEKSPFRAGAERLWRTGSKDATMGQFEAAQMENFLSVQDSFRLEIARKGAMSPGSIVLRSGGQNLPSGVALLVADGKAIKMSRDRQRDWGHNHKGVMAYGLTLENLSRPVFAEDLDIEWAPPETRDEKALLEVLTLKHELGVPVRQILLEMGYDSDEVQAFLDEAEQEGSDAAQAMQVLSGGRTANRAQAQTLAGNLGIPSAPAAPGTPLAS